MSKHRILVATRSAACLALALLVVSVACTNATANDPTPVKTFKITPAAVRTSVTPSVVAVASQTPAASSPTAATTGAANALDIVGRDLTFDRSEISTAPGPTVMRFDNKDAGVLHNLHVFRGTDARGEGVGATKLAAGTVTQELQLNLTPGTYFYQCDAHPTSMKGTLTVTG